MTFDPLDPGASRRLLDRLLGADTEADVITALRGAGLWDTPAAWRLYGDQEDNYSPAGSQQRNPEAALVEKVVNSVDACLMLKALQAGIDLRGTDAPSSPREAVAIFYDDATPGDVRSHQGFVANWTKQRRTAVAQDSITLAVTGATRTKPSITVADRGEGQSPDTLPTTILSLLRGIKKEIPFVQGKFNMGGTGALRFCGDDSLQLVLSKRNPMLAAREGKSHDWGYTVVRRERPSATTRVSTYKYLAPVGSSSAPGKGEVLRFDAATLPILPDGQDAYARSTDWGTLIKMYEYDLRARSMILRSDGLMGRLEVMLPGLMLPVRVHECRAFTGKAGSFANTLTGLEVRLHGQEGDEGNLETGFPDSGHIAVRGERIGVTIYAFRRDKAKAYKRSEGVLFVVNGQTHASFPDRFFQRKALGLGYLQSSLLVVLDCTGLQDGTREDLFMNSRDRLADGTLAHQIEEELVDLLRSKRTLGKLANDRRQEDLATQLEESKPIEDVLKAILHKSPSLARLFLPGMKLTSSFTTATAPVIDAFEGRAHPTFFRFKDRAAGTVLTRDCHLGQRLRLDFETDAVNDYFRRATTPGEYQVTATLNGEEVSVNENLNLDSGLAHLNIKLPDAAQPGDAIEIEVRVTDASIVEPFLNSARVTVRPQLPVSPGGVGPKEKRPPKGPGSHSDTRPGGLQLPEPHWVRKAEWEKHDMTAGSAMRITSFTQVEGIAGVIGAYDYFLNEDNIYLQGELKTRPRHKDLIKAKFRYGMALAAMASVKYAGEREGEQADSDDDESASLDLTAEDIVRITTDSLAPILLPTIEALGDLGDVSTADEAPDSDEGQTAEED